MELNTAQTPSASPPDPPASDETAAMRLPDPEATSPTSPVEGSRPTLQGRYRLGELLGRGGMGDVFAGTDLRLDRPVAVKVLSPAASRIPGSRQRFEQEARMAALISHPNVVSVYDTGEDSGDAFIVMELVSGGTLSEALEKGPLSPYAAVQMGEDLLSALSAAHGHGMLHRDVKPGNVLASPGNQWKVADFGIAKTLSSDLALTSTGLVVGTAAYLAPEILAGRSASVQSDLWAASAVLYEALCGARPYAFAPEHANALTVPLVPLASRAPHLPRALTALVDRGLSADPASRFDSADEMLAALSLVKPLLSPEDGPTEVLPLPAAPPGGVTTVPPLLAPEVTSVPAQRRSPVSPAARALFALLVLVAMVAAAYVGYQLTSL